MASVVIPAHNEEAVIGRCLDRIIDGAGLDEFEIVVVANGCSDATAEVARARSGVTVIELEQASKIAALNAGDQAASRFPRHFVDADLELDAHALRRVGEVLTADGVLMAAPRTVTNVDGRPWLVRAFYDIFGRLPYASGDHLAGVYSLSEEARGLFDTFPEVLADDLFVSSRVRADQRRTLDDVSFVVHAPNSTRQLVATRARMHAFNAAQSDLMRGAVEENRKGQIGGLIELSREPRLWPRLAAYVGLVVLIKARAWWKIRQGTFAAWDRDETSRDTETEVATADGDGAV
ncbi:MAG: glycosyltransferase [Actinomycetia bacterium]|nr:glycosyltransferase [Actinomycetes bacterium]